MYNLKKNSTKMNKHMYRYTKEQLSNVKEELREVLYFFGYANHPDKEDTETTFVNYSEEEGDVPHD